MRRFVCFALVCLAGCPVAQVVDAGTPKVDAGRPKVDSGFVQTDFSISVEVKGVEGHSLVLKVNGNNDLPVSTAGHYTFPQKLRTGDVYNVTVGTQPAAPTQTCTVERGSGTIEKLDIDDVVVTCVTKRYAIGGTVVGLAGLGLTLRNNGADTLSITKNGAFSFPITFPPNTPYEVTIFNQPVGPVQNCTMSGATGVVGNSDIMSVVVNCSSTAHTVGGTVTGLSGQVTVRNNGTDTLTLTANGSFAFGVPIEGGNPYSVEVITQPGPNQSCFVDQGIGTVGATDVTSVKITCTTDTHFVGGTLTGLGVQPVELSNNGSNLISLSADGTFRFPKPIASGAAYDVRISRQPPRQRCAVTRGSGTIDALDVTSVSVTCADTFFLGVDVSGYAAPFTITNAGENLVVTQNGYNDFVQRLLPGESYSLIVTAQPAGGVSGCSVENPVGLMPNAGLRIRVRCLPIGTSCDGLLTNYPGIGDGRYYIDPDGSGPIAPFSAYCDMTRDEGGWMLVTPELVFSASEGANVELVHTLDAFGGIIQEVKATGLHLGTNCDVDAWNALILDDIVPWTQVRANWEFKGNAGCWSIFGNVTEMGTTLNLAPYSAAAGDWISQQIAMGPGGTQYFDGVTARCSDAATNFWSYRNGNFERRARLILHRTSTAALAGLGVGSSCALVDDGINVRPTWKFSDVWIR